MGSSAVALKADRIRGATHSVLNSRIDVATAYSISHHKRQSRQVIARRMEELGHEWDIEQVFRVNGTAVALAGLMLGLKGDRKWFLLPGLLLPFLLQQRLTGWCSPLLLLRWLGFRTRSEIEREQRALKPLLDKA